MPGGDKPGGPGGETPDLKTGESITSIQHEQKEKSDVMSDPESSKSDSAPRHESDSGSGLLTPDLTPDCSSSLPFEQRERSTSTEVPSEDKETSGALEDSEISKSDPSSESDTGSGLQSPDLNLDSQTSTSEHIGSGQTKTKKESCPVEPNEAEAKYSLKEEKNIEVQEERNIELGQMASQVGTKIICSICHREVDLVSGQPKTEATVPVDIRSPVPQSYVEAKYSVQEDENSDIEEENIELGQMAPPPPPPQAPPPQAPLPMFICENCVQEADQPNVPDPSESNSISDDHADNTCPINDLLKAFVCVLATLAIFTTLAIIGAVLGSLGNSEDRSLHDRRFNETIPNTVSFN